MNRTGRQLLTTARSSVPRVVRDPFRQAGSARGFILGPDPRRPFNFAGLTWERKRRVPVLRVDAGL